MKIENLSLSNSEKIALVISLSTMLSSGIMIIDAIDSLLEDAKGNQKKVLTILREDLSQGKRIYVSFSRFPRIFNKVNINIIKAAEESGTLDTTLKQIKDNFQRESEFLDKVKSALMYPIFVLFVFVGVMLMILIVVVPKIATVFLRLRVKLPLPTRIMMFLSDILIQHTIPLLIGVAIFIALIVFLFKTQRKFMLNTIFSLPLISSLIVKIDLVQFTRNLAILLNSGIIITNSLELCEDIVLNNNVHAMIKECKTTIYSGKRLSEGLRKYRKVIPSLMLKVIEAGEKSGTLNLSLKDISEYLDYEVTGNLKSLTALLEPIMLVFVGILVGGMMLSIIAPIYGLIGQVSPH